ncbi:CDP-archaeol synthase [Halieaceae bacterium IMCC14734]|uniref:CDP-archaeol synthase n=2 Tax=Candidatus Litorirhabdus singularis TaxID=2518993 RepID=A0ABT3TFK7_9GAMM|nr:CDP-archaeol synthase [Candidatus Litorirhabdus singularis]
MSNRFNRPVDGGLVLGDGFPLFGSSKTWRGLVAALMLSAAAALLLGLPLLAGLALGAGSMCGDLLSSFIKRRLGRASSTQFLGLDQIPEALLPLLVGLVWFDYSWLAMALIVAAFFVLELTTSPLFYILGIRRRPF